MKKAQYICFEGVDGVGKTTQIKKLARHLRKQGYKVLLTKDIGSPHLSITKKLRKLMLDDKYSIELTKLSRELISNAMRSIHLENIVEKNLFKYDYIIQDRGFLSAFSYGQACGVNGGFLLKQCEEIIKNSNNFNNLEKLYDKLIILKANPKTSLLRAKSSKKEFKNGDAMENLGDSFLDKVSKNMDFYKSYFSPTTRKIVDVTNKDINQVFFEILKILK